MSIVEHLEQTPTAVEQFMTRTHAHYTHGRADVAMSTAKAVSVAVGFALQQARAASAGPVTVHTMRNALIQVANNAADSAQQYRDTTDQEGEVTSIERYLARWSHHTAFELRRVIRSLEIEFAELW